MDNQKFYWERVTQNHPGWPRLLPKIDSAKVSRLGKSFLDLRKIGAKKCHPIFCCINLDDRSFLDEIRRIFPAHANLTISVKDVFGVMKQVHFAAFLGKFEAYKMSYPGRYPSSRRHIDKNPNIASHTPLHLAARSGSLEIIQYIFKYW